MIAVITYYSTILLCALNIVHCVTHCKIVWIWYHIQSILEVNVNIMWGHSFGLYMYMCPIRKGLQDGAISLYGCKIFDKVQLRTVSNIAIYCLSGKFGTVYQVQYSFEYSTVNSHALCNSFEDMACCWSECILTFFYAGDNSHYEIEKHFSNIHYCSVHFTLHPTP